MSGSEHNGQLWQRALRVIPGGVNSPVRSFSHVGGTPVFFKSARGAYLYGEDGRKYIDLINSWGAMILGHAHPGVIQAIADSAQHSTSFGAPTQLEVELAELVVSMVPGIDKVRMVSSGTEACMTAIRLARGYTGKNKIVKFEGCYHGHSDALLAKAGSGVATLNIPQVPGIPPAVLADTLTLPYNNPESVEQVFKEYGSQIAAVIIEPVAGNMGCVPPAAGFLPTLRQLCTQHGALLVFDEVMTGFRLAAGGAQQLLNIKADLITYGKVIGGGMPIGAIAGKAAVMDNLAPLGKVYQAGTLSGNPVAVAAGYATLQHLHKHPEHYAYLQQTTQSLADGLRSIAAETGVPVTVNQVGSMISLHFTPNAVTNFAEAASANNERFKQYFHFMLNNGVYLPPSPFESWFISVPLGQTETDKVLELTGQFLKLL